MFWGKSLMVILAALVFCCAGAAHGRATADETGLPGDGWHFGFGKRQILPDADSDQPLYIAGYHNGVEITDVLDYCEARAVWLDAGGDGVLLIGVDCVALDSGVVAKIRAALADVPGCASVNVYATHTHAGADTLGLWGPVGIDGKNGAYMASLIDAAVGAAREAAAGRRAGTLRIGQVKTQGMYRDSRFPTVYDENLYQLRAVPADGGAGVRMLFYGAHAESLRGDNTRLSRDYPGRLCDRVAQETGDEAMFLPGAIGGLIMTREFVANMPAGAERNMAITADRLTDYALSIAPESERVLAPRMALSSQTFVVPLDNPVFMSYRFLGILSSDAVSARSATGYGVRTELSVLMLDDLALTLIPGELFPELVTGEAYGDANPDGVNPRPLREIAAAHGIGEFLIVGLANDELGYIVPPSDFLLNEQAPYLKRTMDRRGEDHYEETNSVGPACAACIADAFDAALAGLEAATDEERSIR